MFFFDEKKMTTKEFDDKYGHTKLDRALSYAVYGIERACIIAVGLGMTYTVIKWIADFISNWIYNSFIR